MAINNIRTVNSNAADITDNCMMSVSDLGEIKNDNTGYSYTWIITYYCNRS